MPSEFTWTALPAFEATPTRVQFLRTLARQCEPEDLIATAREDFDEGRRELLAAIDWLEGGNLLTDPNLSQIDFAGLTHAITGGVTGGDAPNDAYVHLEALGHCQPILEAAREYCRDDMDRGHMRLEDVLDRMRTYLATRMDGGCIATVAIIRATYSTIARAQELERAEDFFPVLSKAVTQWVNECEDAVDWYVRTSEDANIGDLDASGYIAAIIARFPGMVDLNIDTGDGEGFDFDAPLVDESALSDDTQQAIMNHDEVR